MLINSYKQCVQRTNYTKNIFICKPFINTILIYLLNILLKYVVQENVKI